MRVPAAAIGICYPSSGIQRLVESLGVSMARRVLLAAEEFDASAMLAMGFLDHLVPRAGLVIAIEEYATRLSGLAPLAVRSMKSILAQVHAGSVDEEQVREMAEMCAESADLKEGLLAQREKRQPRFSGA